MNRPPLEVADLVRTAGRAFIEHSRRWINWQHLKVLRAIARCRTAALGGHLDECTDCAYRPPISYNSCRVRHCPKCQANALHRWLEPRRQELLPTPYVHVVFTLPHELAPLALQNKKILYHLLLQTSAETLLQVARDPQHLGAEIGSSVCFTLGIKNSNITPMPIVWCPPADCRSITRFGWHRTLASFFRSRCSGGFSPQVCQRSATQLPSGQAWLPWRSEAPRTPQSLLRLVANPIPTPLARLLQPPFGDAQQAVRYLGHYTHRVAISNHRLVSLVDNQVTFRWRDRARNNQPKLMTLSLDEFLRRFLLHLLPKGFVRIRHFGFLANRRRATLLPLCFRLLAAVQPSQTEPDSSPTQEPTPLWLCPKCGGRMMVIERLTAAQIQLRSPPFLVAVAP